jgi:hypothetical protein
MLASTASRSKPWNPDPHANRESSHTGSNSFNVTNNLVPGDNRQRWMGKLPINDVKIGATNSARGHANQNLPFSKLRVRLVHENQRLSWTLKDHRFHNSQYLSFGNSKTSPPRTF